MNFSKFIDYESTIQVVVVAYKAMSIIVNCRTDILVFQIPPLPIVDFEFFQRMVSIIISPHELPSNPLNVALPDASRPPLISPLNASEPLWQPVRSRPGLVASASEGMRGGWGAASGGLGVGCGVR